MLKLFNETHCLCKLLITYTTITIAYQTTIWTFIICFVIYSHNDAIQKVHDKAGMANELHYFTLQVSIMGLGSHSSLKYMVCLRFSWVRLDRLSSLLGVVGLTLRAGELPREFGLRLPMLGSSCMSQGVFDILFKYFIKRNIKTRNAPRNIIPLVNGSSFCFWISILVSSNSFGHFTSPFTFGFTERKAILIQIIFLFII